MSDTELLYGFHVVRAALQREPERVMKLLVDRKRRDTRVRELLRAASTQGIPVERVPGEELDSLQPVGRHQGVVAFFQGVPPQHEEILGSLLRSLRESPLLLVLDGVQDPHNLGACLRTANAAGVNAVITPRARAAGLTGAVRRVACGGAETVPLIQVANLARTLRGLRCEGIWIVGAADDAPVSLYEADLSGPLALALGAEERGLKSLTREHCDALVHIPMAGTVESLNVAVAAGVLLFEARRQRRVEPLTPSV
jgi:rRNA methylase, putative, group 3